MLFSAKPRTFFVAIHKRIFTNRQKWTNSFHINSPFKITRCCNTCNSSIGGFKK
nr:MAG TPA: Endoplasmic reticulum vesicle transporter [Caudoviricetes sp.]